MHNAKIFLIGKDKEDLTPMVETEYSTEDILQVLLAKYPDLIPGDQIDPDDPPRWLLVGREMSVPGDTGEAGRWSLDHLFLDQFGTPTFVECKRSSDTRARREVVAQMLDYAANGTEYWTMAQLREAAAQTAQRREKSIDDEIRQLAGAAPEDQDAVEAYWKLVEENLREGRVRLLFVADETSRELRRLVEFLNLKMADVEVLAVEIKQFLSDNHRVLAPRVIGATEAARDTKGGRTARIPHTTRQAFLAACSPAAAAFFERILHMADEKRYTVYFGTKGFSVRVYSPTLGRVATFIYGWPDDSFNFYFGDLHLPDAQASALREKLMGFGVLEERGEKTLRADVNAKTADALNRVVDFIFQEIANIVEAH